VLLLEGGKAGGRISPVNEHVIRISHPGVKNEGGRIRTGIPLYLLISVVDPAVDLDPACHFDADPDPTFHFDADPDPDPTSHFDAIRIRNQASK
jgi:hypothetical protein